MSDGLSGVGDWPVPLGPWIASLEATDFGWTVVESGCVAVDA